MSVTLVVNNVPKTAPGLILPTRPGAERPSATRELQALLAFAHQRYKELGPLERVDDARWFNKRFTQALLQHQLARVASGRRGTIALGMLSDYLTRITFRDKHGKSHPLLDFVRSNQTRRYALTCVDPIRGSVLPDNQVKIRFDGEEYQGKDRLQELREKLLGQHWLTPELDDSDALDRFSKRDGRIHMRDQNLSWVMIGGTSEYGIEMAHAILRAGGRLLIINRDPEKLTFLKQTAEHYGGKLSYVEGGANLLEEPDRVMATIRDFAGKGKVHLGLFAYDKGEGKAAQLALLQHAIAWHLLLEEKLGALFSVTSPAMPTQVTPKVARVAKENYETHRGHRWAYPLLRPGIHEKTVRTMNGIKTSFVADAGVDAGVAELKASYSLGKFISELSWQALAARSMLHSCRPITMAHPTLPIADTQSMRGSRIISKAMQGARHYDVWVAPPEEAASLAAAMLFDGTLDPESPGALNPEITTAHDMEEVIEGTALVRADGGIGANGHALGSLVYCGFLAASTRGLIRP